MRCLDVTRELAAPTGQIDAADLDRHLAACPRCAAWARQAERLDRVWETTRPAEPSPAAFQAAWSRVREALDAPAAPVVVRPVWTRWAVAITVAAQAAVLVIAAVVLFRGSGNDAGVAPIAGQRKPAGPIASLSPTERQSQSPAAHTSLPRRVDVTQGPPVMIRLGGEEIQIKTLEQMEASNMVAADFDMFNTFEALAQ